nr:hypothetical protein [Tanacetum cinerariifolium]
LGAHEDASKQGRIIKEIDQNAEIALDDETHGRTNDDEMFEVDDLTGEEMRIDEEYVRRLEAEEQEAAKLSRAQLDEEANNSWDNIQA